jgi:hypothetical protein
LVLATRGDITCGYISLNLWFSLLMPWFTYDSYQVTIRILESRLRDFDDSTPILDLYTAAQWLSTFCTAYSQ